MPVLHPLDLGSGRQISAVTKNDPHAVRLLFAHGSSTGAGPAVSAASTSTASSFADRIPRADSARQLVTVQRGGEHEDVLR